MERVGHLYKRFKNSDLGQTVVKSAAYLAAAQIILPWIEKTKFPIGTGYTEEDYKWDRENMHISVPYGTLAIPVIEETLFRGIPNILADKKKPSWKMAIASSLIFALAHNLNIDRRGKTTFEAKKFPLSQFAGGLFLWHIMRKHGFKNAVVSHSVTNSTLFALDMFNERMNKKPPAKQQENKS